MELQARDTGDVAGSPGRARSGALTAPGLSRTR